MTKALVVGGGIAGISTAVALSQRGVSVDLVERDAEIRTLGSGITLITPAMRALEILGVLPECLERGYGMSEMEVLDINGELLAVMPLPPALGSDLPGMMGMMRPTLHRILIDRAAALGLVARTGVRPTTIDNQPDRAVVTFSDATVAEYDVVVGADGIRSGTRELVSGSVAAVFQHQICYRIVVPRPESVTSEVAFVGCPTANIGFTPTNNDTMYVYCLVPAEAPTRPVTADLPGIVRGHLAPFGGVVTALREQITDPSQINYAALETVLAPEPWFLGRTVLVGDAAHSTTPHLAAGAAMCLEDGLVLAEELAQHAAVPDALLAYSKRRFDRCKYVVETSALLGHWQTHPNSPGADQEGLRAEAFALLAGQF